MAVRIALFLLFLGAGASAEASFWKKCTENFRLLIGDARLNEQRARAALERFHAEYGQKWAARATPKPPEDLMGLSTDQAVEFLKGMKGQSLWGLPTQTITNRAWGNTVSIVDYEGRKVVIKRDQQRSNAEGDRVVTFYSFPRYETIAFALDRYLGTNLVTPSVMLNGSTVAMLYIPGGTAVGGAERSDPSRLVEMSHIRLLDLLVVNGDRDAGSGNLLRRSDRLIALDFDLAKPFYQYFGYGQLIQNLHPRVTLEPDRWVNRNGPMPGVFHRQVVEKLKALDRDTLVRVMKERGVALTENEIRNILGSRQQVLLSIERWRQIYGDDLILIGN